MSEFKAELFDKLFEGASWYEDKQVMHIGHSTGKPGHWIAHLLCQKHPKHWIGFSEVQYAKTRKVCDVCAALFIANKAVQFQSQEDQKEPTK